VAIYLASAIVQKIERPADGAVLLSIRAPGRNVSLLVIGGARPAIGEIERPSSRVPADAMIQKLRRALEGARVVGVARDTVRVVFRRGEDRAALLATREGVVLVEGVDDLGPDAAYVEDESDALRARATEALEQHLQARREARRRAIVSAIEGQRKKLRRRLEAIAEDLAKIERADEWQAQGTLLVTHQYLVQRGATSVMIDDWSSGEATPVTITLDPSKSAQHNADALFHRARRMKKGRAVAEERRAATERALAQLDAIIDDARSAEDDAALEVIESRARASGVKVSKLGTKKRAEIEERSPFHTIASGDRKILVGRGAKDNDALTTKHARPHDLWLHAKGWTGAHVIVPLEKNESCPSELLIDAAHLAAHFSDARGESVVEIQYTPRKYVRKPKGSAPGAVVVDREKVLVLRVDPVRVERLIVRG